MDPERPLWLDLFFHKALDFSLFATTEPDDSSLTGASLQKGIFFTYVWLFLFTHRRYFGRRLARDLPHAAPRIDVDDLVAVAEPVQVLDPISVGGHGLGRRVKAGKGRDQTGRDAFNIKYNYEIDQQLE